MPDWKRLVEKRLAPSRLTPEVQREVVAEIAEHLEDCHDELQKAGRSDPQGETLAQVSDWTGQVNVSWRPSSRRSISRSKRP
jgi:hypothetical protein